MRVTPRKTQEEDEFVKRKYLYYPDRLVTMPGPGSPDFWVDVVQDLFTSPLYKNLLPSLVKSMLTRPRESRPRDESVGDWFARQFGRPDLVDNIISGVLHGIYAGDVYKLSMKSLLPQLWAVDSMRTFFTDKDARRESIQATISETDRILTRMMLQNLLSERVHRVRKYGDVYTFAKGMSMLPDTLAQKLDEAPNVTIKRRCTVSKVSISKQADGGTQVWPIRNPLREFLSNLRAAYAGREVGLVEA